MNIDNSRLDLAVFAKDYPELRLVVEVKTGPIDLNKAARQLAHHMWGANCHYGLIFTPSMTHVLRDDFSTHGAESIRITDAVPTARLLGRLGRQVTDTSSEHEFERFVREWLELLAESYEIALPDDPEIAKAFFPEIVGAVAEGRVVAEGSLR